MILHLGEGEAILGVTVSLGHNGINDTAFLKEATELFLDFFGIGLDEEKDTLPSRLVMKSLQPFCLSSERDRSRRLLPLEELDSDIGY